MRDEIPDPMELQPITQRELDEALARHVMYLHGEKGGARCVLQYRNLSRLNFRGGDCTQADFAASMIIDADLSDGKFLGANFFGCDMRNTDLSNANLTRADLRGAYIAGADLTGAILKEADMREGKIMKRDRQGVLIDRKRSGGEGAKTVLIGAKLTNTNMQGAQAIAADFTDADLSHVVLTQANLRGVNFAGANLADSDLTGADLTDASMRESIIAGAIMDKTEKHNLDISDAVTERDMGSKLENLGKTLPQLLEEHTLWVSTAGRRGRQLDLSGYDLRDVMDLFSFPLTAIHAEGANFLSQNLQSAELQSAVFDRSDFRDCNMERADLRGSSFKYAQLARANLAGAMLCPLQFNNPDGSKRLQRVDMSAANLRYANLADADLRDCILAGVDLSSANLRGADLRRADLTAAILKGALIEGAKLDDAKIDLTSI